MSIIKKSLLVASATILAGQVAWAAPAKNPPITAGMTVLLDAADIDANGQVDTNYAKGESVASWFNKSALNGGKTKAENNFFPISDTKQPKISADDLNGHALVDFDRSGLTASQLKFITTDGPYTKVVLFKIDRQDTNNNNLVSTENTALWTGQQDATDKMGALKAWHQGTGNGNFLADTKLVTVDDYHIAVVRYGKPASLSNVLRLDGTTVATNNVAKVHASSTAYIGSLGSTNSLDTLDGKIAEVIIYDKALSDTDIVKIEKYLKTKWGGLKGQKITLTISAAKKEKGSKIGLTATSSSKLPVSFETVAVTSDGKKPNGTSNAICSIENNKIKLNAVGKCGVLAGQDGNATYREAEPVFIAFDVKAVTTTPTTPPATSKSSGGGGSSVWLLMLGLITLIRRKVLLNK